jgi:indole-3-glycerol phosphate synthase
MILDTIAQATRVRVEKAKARLPLKELKEMLYEENKHKDLNGREKFAFEQALRNNKKRDKNGEMAFICEVKRLPRQKG